MVFRSALGHKVISCMTGYSEVLGKAIWIHNFENRGGEILGTEVHLWERSHRHVMHRGAVRVLPVPSGSNTSWNLARAGGVCPPSP